jgi:hypothetical protein
MIKGGEAVAKNEKLVVRNVLLPCHCENKYNALTIVSFTVYILAYYTALYQALSIVPSLISQLENITKN